MKKLIFLTIFFSFFAQSQTENEINVLRDKWILDKQKNDEWQSSTQLKLEQDEEKLKMSQAKLQQLEDIVTNKASLRNKALKQIEDALDNLTSTERVVSRKAAFFRCVRRDLKQGLIPNVQSCRMVHSANFTGQDEKLIQSWSETIALTSSEINSRKYKFQKEISFTEGLIVNDKKMLSSAAHINQKLLDTETHIKSLEFDRKLIDDNSMFVNCDSKTPAISLEEKIPFPGAEFQGPFYNVPRDNQDGLGTCYANTAKNLLVGASKGKDIASFLDMALIYKGNSGVLTDGLDAGMSCETLEKVQEVGYCPQEFAPFERGEKNVFTDGLMGQSGNVFDQSRTINLLRNFFEGQLSLGKNNKDISEQILKQAQVIINNLKARPNVKIPLPVARHQIPSDWKIQELSYLKSQKAPFHSRLKFISDYEEGYRDFYPWYIRAVVEGKNRDEIFDLFKEKMKPFLDKYQISEDLSIWKTLFLNDTESDWSGPTLKKDVIASVSFLKIMSGIKDATDEEFFKQCADTKGVIPSFLSTLQPLVKYMTDQKIDSNILFDENGKFKSASDLIQLTVAPNCIHPENRIRPADDFICENGYDTISQIRNSGLNTDNQKKMLREKVVVNLVQGYPMGNTFGASTIKHINTVVGMRFNKESNQCEFQIRESQSGTSFWQSEQSFFGQIEALTVVRRK